MKKTTAGIMVIAFIALAVAATTLADTNTIFFGIVKSLLVPVLILLLLCSTTAIADNKKIMLTGLFFSWVGDVLLLFESRSALFFIAGLVCFLTTHICYILYFLKVKSNNTSLIRKQPWLAALVAGYGVSLVMFLYPHLGEMKIPVMLYAAVICTMVICSLYVFTKINTPANMLFVVGAVFFATSDSLLAVNKFYKSFGGAGAFIIATYCAAQFFIVMGVIKRTN